MPGVEEIRFDLNQRQLEVWRLVANAPPDSLTIIGYGGAAGPGKTYAGALLGMQLAITYPGNRVLIGRKDFADLRTTTMEEFYKLCPPAYIAKKHDSEHWCALRLPSWPAGVTSRVFFKELKDFLSVGSEEYGTVIIDEAGEVPESSALMLVSRLRHPAVRKRVMFAASNPWPGWFKRWFIDKTIPEDVLKAAGGSIHFVRAVMGDNPHLPNNYEAMLRALYPADWIKRFVDGSWEAFEGQVHPDLSPQLCWQAPLPPFKSYVAGLDFGGQNPFDHMTAGVIAGVTGEHPRPSLDVPYRACVPGSIIRLAHFEDRGPHVYEVLFDWLGTWQEKVGRRIHTVADKSQMVGIDYLQRHSPLWLTESHGGPGSVSIGIGLQNARFANGTSFFVPALNSPPSSDSAMRGAKSWYERMEAYAWDKPRDEFTEAKREPIKIHDDTPNADRYMSEAVDGWPVRTGSPVVLAGPGARRKGAYVA